MSNYLNKGNKSFLESLDSPIYVDKTGLIGYTNDVVSTKLKYICVTRPRRFGKSTAAEMLRAYYCRTCDSHSQFDGLAVSKTDDYETHINKYDVISVKMTDLIKSDVDVKTGLSTFTKRLIHDLRNAYPEVNYEDKGDVFAMLNDIYSETESGFVFIIDEWDSPFRVRKSDTDGHGKYVEFLMDLLKDKDYVELAYMTGILPIKKFCTNSSLNMFQEYSMEIPGPVKSFFGFTDDEVKALCDERGFPYDSIKDWYDGYIFEKKPGERLHMYNANSVVSAIVNNQLASYWPRTESLRDLKQYIKLNKDGLHDVIFEMLAGGIYQVHGELFSVDDEDQKYLKEVIGQLVNLGYLAYDLVDGTVCIPNLEVRREFLEVISGMGDDPLCELLKLSSEILDATLKKNGEKLATLIAKFHGEHAATRNFNDESTLADVLRFAFVSALSEYRTETEVQAKKGYAYLIFTPYEVWKNVPMIVELKYNKTAEEAIEKIEDRQYAGYFDRIFYKGEILFVGINYGPGIKEDGTDGTYNVKFETVKI
ncbi:MAG: AAA family ATPase [Clostridia bacterium]|nr:AAA family ATPase [Clostridia bacterium]